MNVKQTITLIFSKIQLIDTKQNEYLYHLFKFFQLLYPNVDNNLFIYKNCILQDKQSSIQSFITELLNYKFSNSKINFILTTYSILVSNSININSFFQ